MNTKENVLSKLSLGLNRERTAYKVVGIVSLILAILLIVFGFISMVSGAYLTATETESYEFDSNIYSDNFDSYEIDITDEDVAILAGASVVFLGGFYFGFGFSLLAIAIVNLCLASRAGKHLKDSELTVKHAGSVGSIVLAALFNEIALIFVVINFVTAKKNRNVL